MTRAIKFRAWDKNNKRMVYNFLLSSDNGVFALKDPCTPSGDSMNFVDLLPMRQDVIVMQFTGMRDRNGREIYEGDLCAVLFGNGKTHKAVVAFIDGCFELNFYYPVVIGRHYNDRDYLKCSTVNHAAEVIGNIYGNPELLVVAP